MSAIQQLLTDHIDIWTAADTGPKSGRGRSSSNAASVYGIRKLRELILELAMRGKLVPQEAAEEPACELLKRLQVEKTKLIAAGKIKKDKTLPPITEDEKPFQLLEGWGIERLGNLAHLITKGTTPTSLGFSYQNAGIRFVKVENVSDGRININSIDQYISEEADDVLSRSRLMTNDVLFSIAGTIGRTCIIYPADIPANTNQAFAIIRGTKTVFDQMFLLRQLDSFVSNKTKDRARGGAMYNVSLSDLADLVLIIPPLAEQHRIVAKVDELMALCDQLEAQHSNAVDAHEKLVSHLLGTLTQSQSAEDFSSNWQRIAEHFDTLFTTEASIDALKQTLLQLAVMGKLVPQDANDEPASVLLQRLADDAKKYAAKRKIAQPKPELISSADLPSFAPNGWVWTRLCSIFRVITDGDHQSPPQVEDGVAFLTIGNITAGRLEFSGCRFVPKDYFESVASYRRPEFGDILYTVVGATYGRPVFVDSHQKFCVQRHIAILKCSEHLDVKFACHLLSSPEVYEQATQCTTGTAQPTIPLRPLRNFLILLPPLAEQRRIVAKVDELMAVCDQLKSRITDASKLQQKLADVMVERVAA